jgi:hypothetical protein
MNLFAVQSKRFMSTVSNAGAGLLVAAIGLGVKIAFRSKKTTPKVSIRGITLVSADAPTIGRSAGLISSTEVYSPNASLSSGRTPHTYAAAIPATLTVAISTTSS